MRVLSPKLIEWYGNPTHWCPACKAGHPFLVKVPNIKTSKPLWSFNGDYDRPSFAPSMRIFWTDRKTSQEHTVCHYFLTDGQIKYCEDSPHKFAGKTIDLPDFPEEQFQYYEEANSWGQPSKPPNLTLVKK